MRAARLVMLALVADVLAAWAVAPCSPRVTIVGLPLRLRARVQLPFELCTVEHIAATIGSRHPQLNLSAVTFDGIYTADGVTPADSPLSPGQPIVIHAVHVPVDHAFALIVHGVASAMNMKVHQWSSNQVGEGGQLAEELLMEHMNRYPVLKENWHYHHNLAVLYRQQDRIADAAESMARAAEAGSNCVETFMEAAECFKIAGQPERASEFYEHVFSALRYSAVSGRRVLYPMHSCSEHPSLLAAVSGGYYERMQKAAQQVTVLRLRHDLSQMRMLAAAHPEIASYSQAVEQYTVLQQQVTAIAPEPYLPEQYQRDSSNATDPSVRLPDPWREKLSAWFNKATSVPATLVSKMRRQPREHVVGQACESSALNIQADSLNAAEVEATYEKEKVVYVDNFLSHQALKALQRFVQVIYALLAAAERISKSSTIWFETKKIGYLGSYWHDGFSNPLLLQVARELGEKLPHIFQGQPLMQMWGYKYDSNVNFWLTPDEAVIDKDNGGLRIFLKDAPEDWEFKDYNTNHKKIFDFLEADGGSKEAVVPYRENRAVIFHSNFFHTTDTFKFRCCKYKDRRINVTMLFGKRFGRTKQLLQQK